MGNGAQQSAPASGQLDQLLRMEGRRLSSEAISELNRREARGDFTPEEIAISLQRAAARIVAETEYGDVISAASINDFIRDLCPDFPPFC